MTNSDPRTTGSGPVFHPGGPPANSPPETNVFWSAASLFDRMFNKVDELSLKLDAKADKSDIALIDKRLADHAMDDRQAIDKVNATLAVVQTTQAKSDASGQAVSKYKSKVWAFMIGASGLASSVAIVLSVIH